MTEMNKPKIKLTAEDLELWGDILLEAAEEGQSAIRAYNVSVRYLTGPSGVLVRMTLLQALLDDDVFADILMSRNCGTKTGAHLKRARRLLIERCENLGTTAVPEILSLEKANPELFKQFAGLYDFFGWDYAGDKISYESARANSYVKRAEKYIQERNDLLNEEDNHEHVS